jgi:hypothetical protein
MRYAHIYFSGKTGKASVKFTFNEFNDGQIRSVMIMLLSRVDFE